MKTALVISAIVIDGISHAPGATVTADKVILAPFVNLSLASWVLEAEAIQPPAKPAEQGAAEVVPTEVKSAAGEDHAG